MDNTEISINNYINDDLSICREERQYALYLSNILRYYGKAEHRRSLDTDHREVLTGIFQKSGICSGEIPDGLEVINVFYEVTFMRDFLERNRRIYLASKGNDISLICRNQSFQPSDHHLSDMNKSFNKKLLDYAGSVIRDDYGVSIDYDDKDISEVNYGRNDIPIKASGGNAHLAEEAKFLIRSMMNAKPDLAVIYVLDDSLYLKFIECKFESAEDRYTDKDKEICFSQTEIQWHIARFLYENDYLVYYVDGKEKKIKLSEQMSVPFEITAFDRGRSEDKIAVKDLIDLEKTVFI